MSDSLEESTKRTVQVAVAGQPEKFGGVLEEDPVSREMVVMPESLSDLHGALLRKFLQSGDPLFKEAADQIRGLRRQLFECEVQNTLLQDQLAELPQAAEPALAELSEADKALDRPWQTNGHGHYEYIETICDAYESGIGDGLNGKPLDNPYNGRQNPDQNAAFEIGHIAGLERKAKVPAN